MKSIKISKLDIIKYKDNLMQSYQLLDYTNKRCSMRKWFRSKNFAEDDCKAIIANYYKIKREENGKYK